ncbi:hypothetical protein BH11ACT8_BH11ACT8_08180 [soil metagenome]
MKRYLTKTLTVLVVTVGSLGIVTTAAVPAATGVVHTLGDRSWCC